MRILPMLARTLLAFITATAATFALSAGFYTNQVLAAQIAIGAEFTPGQTVSAYLDNAIGLAPAFGAVLAIALALGFAVAFGAKRVLRPLAPLAYPIAGAASVVLAITLIETVMGGGGAGVIGGARTPLGLALQGAAGAAGGFVFAMLRPHR